MRKEYLGQQVERHCDGIRAANHDPEEEENKVALITESDAHTGKVAMVVSFKHAAIAQRTVIRARRPMLVTNRAKVPAARRRIKPNAVRKNRQLPPRLPPVGVNLIYAQKRARPMEETAGKGQMRHNQQVYHRARRHDQ